RGCLIWQEGLGSTKKNAARVWQGAAALGLATFSIDFHKGSRAISPARQAVAARDPVALAAVVNDTISDLRSAIAYLQSQPLCRGNVAYAGVSLGGILGTILAGTDREVDAAVIMSTPATWQSAIASGAILPGVQGNPQRLKAAHRLLAPLD